MGWYAYLSASPLRGWTQCTDRILADADRKLFLTILSKHSISVDYKAVAEAMSSEGRILSVEAIKSRLKKLRKMAGEGDVEYVYSLTRLLTRVTC